MNEQTVRVTPATVILVLLSIAALTCGIYCLRRKWKQTGKFSWKYFVGTVFFAVLLYDLAMWRMSCGLEALLISVFHTLQTLTANRDFEFPTLLGVGQVGRFFIAIYGIVLFIVTPISIVSAASEYFSGTITSWMLRRKTSQMDGYVFSRLDELTFKLAQDVKAHHGGKEQSEQACVVFALCGEAEEGLRANARAMGAICFDWDVVRVVRRCSRHKGLSIVLLEEDEELAITTARKIKDEVGQGKPSTRVGDTTIFVLTDFRSAEALLLPEVLSEKHRDEGAEQGKVLVRGIDLANRLVEQVMIRYPLFLLSKPMGGVSKPASKEEGSRVEENISPNCWYDVDVREVARKRQFELYNRYDRHILVVGAGSIGREFLSSALWASRVDGMRMRVDVIDNVENPLKGGETMAEARIGAMAPEIIKFKSAPREIGCNEKAVESVSCKEAKTGEPMGTEESYDLGFSLIDAETKAYIDFLEKNAGTLTYVFIALGDDLLNARIAMRTRQILDRKLAERSASRTEFLCANRPVIVTTIRDDDFAEAVRHAVSEGQPYDIVCVGNNEAMLTSDMLDSLPGDRETEYKRRSSRASATHAKYRMFAFARHLLLNDAYDIRAALGGVADTATLGAMCENLHVSQVDPMLERMCEAIEGGLDNGTVLDLLSEVDWTVDTYRKGNEFPTVKRWAFALLYQFYCTNGVTRPLSVLESDDEYTREWLLRMEHERWNAYVRTQGMVRARLELVANVFATGQSDKEKHRSSIMACHPCLAPFDDLALLEEDVYQLYSAYFSRMDELGRSEDRNKKMLADPNDSEYPMKDYWMRLQDESYVGL